MSSKIKTRKEKKMLHHASPNMKKEAESLIALSGFLRKHFPCQGTALWPIYLVLWSICWITEETSGIWWENM